MLSTQSCAHRLAVAFTLHLSLAVGIASEAPPVATVVMPFDGVLSAAVYSSDGLIVRTLVDGKPTAAGPVVLRWDGIREVGGEVPAATYEIRAIAHQASGIDDGWIGEMADPPYGVGEHGHDINAVAVEPSGEVFETSGWEEAHQEIRRWSVDGKELASREAQGGQGIALDDRFVYQVVLLSDAKPPQAKVRRYTKDSLRARIFVGTPDGLVGVPGGVRAVAASAKYLWLCGPEGVHVVDKATGAEVQVIALADARGVAIDARDHAWVAHGDRISEFTPDGKPGREITGLKKPSAVAFGGPDTALYVGDGDTCQITEYDPTTLVSRRTLFGAAVPGAMSDTAFFWHLTGRASFGVDQAGRITVADVGNHRVLTYSPEGTLIRQRFSEMVMAPMVDVAVDPDVVLSNHMEYRVDYSPGANHGAWKPVNNWYGASMSIRRKVQGHDYLYSLLDAKPGRIVVYDLAGGKMRRCAELIWEKGLRNWTDTDGDGVITDAETVPSEGLVNFSLLAPGLWIDHHGDVLIANWKGPTVRVPLLGIDDKGNPRYDWAKRVTAVPENVSNLGFEPTNVRVDPATGDIYRLGYAKGYKLTNPNFWMGGSVVERISAEGKLLGVFPLVGGEAAVVVATDSDGAYFYTGHSSGDQHWIRMHTNDGLLVTTCRMGGPSGKSGGWMDHGLALSAFTHPKTGVHYAYAEEVYWGKAIRYRIDGLATLKRLPAQIITWPTK